MALRQRRRKEPRRQRRLPIRQVIVRSLSLFATKTNSLVLAFLVGVAAREFSIPELALLILISVIVLIILVASSVEAIYQLKAKEDDDNRNLLSRADSIDADPIPEIEPIPVPPSPISAPTPVSVPQREAAPAPSPWSPIEFPSRTQSGPEPQTADASPPPVKKELAKVPNPQWYGYTTSFVGRSTPSVRARRKRRWRIPLIGLAAIAITGGGISSVIVALDSYSTTHSTGVPPGLFQLHPAPNMGDPVAAVADDGRTVVVTVQDTGSTIPCVVVVLPSGKIMMNPTSSLLAHHRFVFGIVGPGSYELSMNCERNGPLVPLGTMSGPAPLAQIGSQSDSQSMYGPYREDSYLAIYARDSNFAASGHVFVVTEGPLASSAKLCLKKASKCLPPYSNNVLEKVSSGTFQVSDLKFDPGAFPGILQESYPGMPASPLRVPGP